MKHTHLGKTFCGMATLGEKGQAVIPAEARKKMKLAKGEKLLVFSFGDDMLVMSKMKGLEKFAAHLAKQLRDIDEVIKKGDN